jgi:hypothetical protein
MKYDLEIVTPITSKYPKRLDDFKKHGIFNVAGRRVLLTPILSGEDIEELLEGWADGVEVKPARFKSEDYVSNVHKHFLEKEPEARWIMRVDDDSCTDVDGLIKNLDHFYDSEQKFYLGSSLSDIESCAMHGPEVIHRNMYREFFGEMYLKIRHEIECCVVSSVGLKHILSHDKAKKFMKRRSEVVGGAIDVALSFASSLSKLWPIDLPFATYLPQINKFSTFGGYLNHIHMISRTSDGENFHERCGETQFEALVKSIEGSKTEKELMIEGRKFVMESNEELRLFEFRKDRSARIKFDENTYAWAEVNDRICLFSNATEVFMWLEFEDGHLVKRGESEDFVLRPISEVAKTGVIY